MSLAKAGLTAAALGTTAYSRMLGRKVSREIRVPAESGTQPTESTPPDIANAQRQLAVLQWVVPALTGALVGVSSFAGEQQRTRETLKGILARVVPWDL